MDTCLTYADIYKHLQEGFINFKALNYRDSAGNWRATSTEQFLHAVKATALGLRAMGLKPGDCVGIYASGSPYWTIADIAIVLAGGIMVPIFTTISEENFVFEVDQTNLKIIFVEGEEQWAIVNRHSNYFNSIIALGITIGETIPIDAKVKSFATLVLEGNAQSRKEPFLFDQLLSRMTPNSIAAIIYTSGSTGVPKGVELTQQNIIGEVEFSEFSWDNKHDRYLSVLPLEHVFGHCFNIWLLYHGVSIYYSSDHKHLVQICGEVKPTMIAVVPRLLEKVYAKFVEKVHAATGAKRLIGGWAFVLANTPHSFMRKLLSPVLNALVYSKLRQAFGGNLRMLVSGGAPINPRLQHFFAVIGIPVYQGWELTEACPLSATTPMHDKPGTVGRLLPGQTIKISPEGEILVKGSLVMHGYHKNPAQTAQVIDAEGYLHTGDKGVLDSEGYLTIVGRLKELYKSSTGEYIAPVPIEQALARHPLLDMALVIAEGKKYASCLFFPNFEAVATLKAKQNKQSLSDKLFLESSSVQTEMNGFIEEVNKHLNHPEQIHAYRFVMEPLTIKGGELTPSMKIRREPVIQKYKELITTMYPREIED